MLNIDALFDAAAAMVDETAAASPAVDASKTPSREEPRAQRCSEYEDESESEDDESSHQVKESLLCSLSPSVADASSAASTSHGKPPRGGDTVFKRSVTMLTRKLVRDLSESHRRCFPRDPSADSEVYEARLSALLLQKVIPQKVQSLAAQSGDPEALRSARRAENAQRQRAFRDRRRAAARSNDPSPSRSRSPPASPSLSLCSAAQEDVSPCAVDTPRVPCHDDTHCSEATVHRGRTLCNEFSLSHRKRKRISPHVASASASSSSSSLGAPCDLLQSAQTELEERHAGDAPGDALKRESKLVVLQEVVQGIFAGVGKLDEMRESLRRRERESHGALSSDEQAFLDSVRDKAAFELRVKEDVQEMCELLGLVNGPRKSAVEGLDKATLFS